MIKVRCILCIICEITGPSRFSLTHFICTGTQETLIPRYGKIGNDLPLNFADDVDVTKEGIIFFSDAGQAGTYGDIFPDIIGQPTGRLIQYDPKTKKTEVLISGLRFANGVQLSRKEDFVAVCETGMARVWK